jgi:hypothetical protein
VFVLFELNEISDSSKKKRATRIEIKIKKETKASVCDLQKI